MTDRIIYLDHNATTPVDPEVFAAMTPFFLEQYGNAASRHHAMGCEAAKAVETARAQVANALNARSSEITFTSGATEAVNLALRGLVEADPAAQPRVITARTEHKAVLDTCSWLEQRKRCRVTYLAVDQDGLISLDELDQALAEEPAVVAVMHANNETGVLQPIARVGQICKDKGALFFTDATQSFGKEPIDVDEAGIDLLALSAHKIYGPKGTGALYVRRSAEKAGRRTRIRCEPLIHGGGHERGLRSGTLNVPGIVGLGAAARIARHRMAEDTQRIASLRDRLEQGLLRLAPTAESDTAGQGRPTQSTTTACSTQASTKLETVTVNGAIDRRLANTTNISFTGLDAETLMRRVPELAVSTSSACTSAQLQPSYVLGAMGKTDAELDGSVRFSLGRFTTAEEIDRALARIRAAVAPWSS